MIRVKKIENKEELEQAFAIRTTVFVDEQDCPVDEEFDGFDEESVHFIAYTNGKPIGTSRYRTTEKGVKLERFAVLSEYRGKGTGKRLVQTALSQISTTFKPGTLLYLHAQLDAMPLYARYNFEKVGEQFEEAGIQHFKMEKTLEA
ncbi:GNAT family N-acetyltransferase [Roseivirga sp.]|uniref:GNAT family N-acetyltransferase n=1 Tax=Roseivirga sp. TaxID=1964215 RepID=UPI003B8E80F0